MYRMLVAIDGSEPANRAARFAADLARRLGDGEILLLNVQEAVEEMQTHGLAREAIREHREKLAREASAGAHTAVEQSGVPFTFDWQFGDPAQIIARTARESGCSLIIMGTRGAGPIENLLLGSVAYKTLHIAALPVTLVK
jgi:nucleotide-binding universal stress UspA family protein